MRRDFTSPKFALKRTGSMINLIFQKYWYVVGTALLIMLMCLAYLRYQEEVHRWVSYTQTLVYQKLYPEKSQNLLPDPHFMSLRPLLSEHQNRIHFEFYSTLPNAKVELVQQKEQLLAQPLTQPKSNLVAITKDDIKAIAHNSVIPQLNKTDVFNPSKLGTELEKKLKQKNTIIQLGVFYDRRAAEKLRDDCSKAGIKTTLVTIPTSRQTLYRVQQGPYFSQQQVKLAQQKLHEKKINFLIRNDLI